MTTDQLRRRVTLADVARRAGVGTATVDRVMHDRGNVSTEVTQRILRAARDLGLKRLLPEPHRRIVRIDVILARPELPLIARLGFEFRRLASSLDRSISLHRTVLDDERPETLAKALSRSQCDAVVSYLPDHPLVQAAVQDLSSRGIPVVTVVSDLPGSARIGYAGTNHVRSGRSAAYFVAKMVRQPGPVTILCNKLSFQSHADRVRGFSEYLLEKAPECRVAHIVEGGDDRDLSELALKRAFMETPGTVAVYNAGAANIGVARAIRANILSCRPIFVGHELTGNTAALLREGVMSITIDQSPELQVRRAVELILEYFARPGTGDGAPPPVSDVPTVLYGPENIPDPLPF